MAVAGCESGTGNAGGDGGTGGGGAGGDGGNGGAPAGGMGGDGGTGGMEMPEFKAEYCAMVLGTLNIHWEAVGGPFAPCVGVETTNGTVEEAADGTAEFQGIAVSDPECIGMDVYEFVVSGDGLTLEGTAFASAEEVDMVFTRLPSEGCFVGHWVLEDQDYVGHIAAEPFGVTVER